MRKTLQLVSVTLAGIVTLLGAANIQAESMSGATRIPASSGQSITASPSASEAQAKRRAARRRRRTSAAQQQATETAPTTSSQVAPTAAQRRRDAQILAAQKAQSAETARQNTEVTQKVVDERQKQQSEPRIQDAPGPDSQPLAGAPAVAPSQAGDPPRIQDAPGPAQTLPKTPPPPPAPVPQP